MPTDYGLPPSSQRPQVISRFDVPQTNQIQRQREDAQTGVQGPSTQVVQRTSKAFEQRFPTESGIQRFRGEVQGRNLNTVPTGDSLSKLPSQVQPFDPSTANGFVVGSLNAAESAAIGFTTPDYFNNPQEADQSGFAPVLGSEENAGSKAVRQLAENAQERSDREDRLFDRVREENNQDNRSDDVRSELRAQEETVTDRVVENSQEEVVQTERQAEEVPPSQAAPTESTKSNGEPLSQDEAQEVSDLKRRDREVRAHEQAHASAGGQHIRGGVKLSYAQGPDGNRYAVDGEVDIDIGSEATPEATIAKMQQVQSAALAPATPSGADRAAASAASQRELEARSEIREAQSEERQAQASERSNAQAQDNQEIKADSSAKEVEGAEGTENFSGAQAVVPDRSTLPRTSGEENRSLEYESYPLSSPDAGTPRPVEAPREVYAVDQPPEPAKSARLENASKGYDDAIDRALTSFK